MADELVPENDPILTTKCVDWDFNNPPRDAEQLITRMTEVMREERGIGLSANQIGMNARLFIMEIDDRVVPCFNPTIVQASEELISATEGCLSFPDLELKVKRPSWLSVSYQTISGDMAHEIMTDIKARCYAHELDHLNGIRFTDRVSKLTVDMAKKRRSKLQRNSNV
jgi:peptide deformylase